MGISFIRTTYYQCDGLEVLARGGAVFATNDALRFGDASITATKEYLCVSRGGRNCLPTRTAAFEERMEDCMQVEMSFDTAEQISFLTIWKGDTRLHADQREVWEDRPWTEWAGRDAEEQGFMRTIWKIYNPKSVTWYKAQAFDRLPKKHQRWGHQMIQLERAAAALDEADLERGQEDTDEAVFDDSDSIGPGDEDDARKV